MFKEGSITFDDLEKLSLFVLAMFMTVAASDNIVDKKEIEAIQKIELSNSFKSDITKNLMKIIKENYTKIIKKAYNLSKSKTKNHQKFFKEIEEIIDNLKNFYKDNEIKMFKVELIALAVYIAHASSNTNPKEKSISPEEITKLEEYFNFLELKKEDINTFLDKAKK